MSIIKVTADSQSSPLVFVGTQDSNSDYLQVSATSVNLYDNVGGSILAPIDPADGIEPPTPSYLLPPGAQNQPFNYLTLPRLQSQPSNSLIVAIDKPLLLINGTDYSEAFISADWSSPLSGSSVGFLTLKASAGNLDLLKSDIAYQNVASLALTWPQGDVKVFNAYIVNQPVFTLEGPREPTVTLELGDELALFDRSAREPNRLYCGPEPGTAGSAAGIYASLRGLFTRVYPGGHTFPEPPQPVNSESPYQFLQSLYAPIDWDVRTLPASGDAPGAITATPRLPFNGPAAITLDAESTLDVSDQFQNNYDQFSQVTAQNEYQVQQDFGIQITTYTTVSGVNNSDKPWFQGGYTETTTTEHTLGDTLVYSVAITRGYIPTSSTLTEAQVEQGDPCLDSTVDTVFGTLATETYNATYYQHPSGSYLVSKEETWKQGLDLQKQPDDSYLVFNGTLSYQLTEYDNTPQINTKVCQRDYYNFQTRSKTTTFGLTASKVYRQLTQEITRYFVQGSNPNAGQTAFLGTGQTWLQLVSTGAWDEDQQTWVNQPNRTNPNTSPPESKWIRPNFESVVAFNQVDFPQVTGYRPAENLEAPHCFNLDQITNYANRYLREQWGLANSVQVVIPFHVPLTLGSSVYYTDYQGLQLPYLVFNIEYNIQGTDGVKTATLMQATT